MVAYVVPPFPHNPYGDANTPIYAPWPNPYPGGISGRVSFMRPGRFGRRFCMLPSMTIPEPIG